MALRIEFGHGEQTLHGTIDTINELQTVAERFGLTPRYVGGEAWVLMRLPNLPDGSEVWTDFHIGSWVSITTPVPEAQLMQYVVKDEVVEI
jgi:hypothetical protein